MLQPKLVLPRVAPARTFLPTDLLRLYSMPAPSPTHQSIAVLSFGGGLYGNVASDGTLTNGDVQAYWTSLGIAPLPQVRITLLPGAQNAPDINDGGATIENTLDVEMAGACCPNSSITLIIAPNNGTSFLQLLTAAAHANVISCSWGFPESAVPASFLQQVDAQLQALTLAGINVCAAAGDLLANDGTSSPTADFPGSSPHVVCCGGTTLLSATDTYDANTQETVWNNSNVRGTGGGHSRIFAKPSYQSAITLSAYRMVPDIDCDADPNTGVQFLCNGTSIVAGGTSVSAPFVAGCLARLNVRTWITPLLYQAPRSCFHDVVSGNNAGYVATPGYDMASGLGSLNGVALQAFLFPPRVPVSSVDVALGLRVGATAQLRALLSPSNASDQVVTWSSSNPAVVAVNNGGLVRAISAGSATVQAHSVDGPVASVQVVIS